MKSDLGFYPGSKNELSPLHIIQRKPVPMHSWLCFCLFISCIIIHLNSLKGFFSFLFPILEEIHAGHLQWKAHTNSSALVIASIMSNIISYRYFHLNVPHCYSASHSTLNSTIGLLALLTPQSITSNYFASFINDIYFFSYIYTTPF